MILQSSLPYGIAVSKRLPGVSPLEPRDWLHADDAFGPQMAMREALLAGQREAVLGALPDATEAVDEMLDAVLTHLPSAFTRQDNRVVRPDGVEVVVDRLDPLDTLGRIVQEDLCLMQRPEDAPEHILTAAILCFPARWTLAEKLGRPLMRIHAPVEHYDDGVGRRVQRLFDGLQPDRPVWRWNRMDTNEPELFQPMREDEPRGGPTQADGPPRFIRSERQVLWRLPQTRAVVFSIHTYVVHRDGLAM
ncbi:MAG: DUF3445 domain-containing protein [Pseudomonadota bacterium]